MSPVSVRMPKVGLELQRSCQSLSPWAGDGIWEQLAAALWLSLCCSCPLTLGWRRPRAAWQPLDGGISPEFRSSLLFSTSQGVHLISAISYRILIDAKFTVSFSNIQSGKKLIKLKLHSLSNPYFKRKICIFMAQLLMHLSFSVLHLRCSALI